MSINCKPNATNWKSNNKKTLQVSCAPLPLLRVQFSDSDGLEIGIEKIDSGLRDCSSIGKIKLIQFHHPFAFHHPPRRILSPALFHVLINWIFFDGIAWRLVIFIVAVVMSRPQRNFAIFTIVVHHVGIVVLDSALSDGDLQKKSRMEIIFFEGGVDEFCQGRISREPQ